MPKLNAAARAILGRDGGKARRARSSWRLRLFHQQQGQCFYCGMPMLLDADENDPRRCTVDHVLPRSKGGDNSPENLVGACLECNRKKGDWYPD